MMQFFSVLEALPFQFLLVAYHSLYGNEQHYDSTIKKNTVIYHHIISQMLTQKMYSWSAFMIDYMIHRPFIDHIYYMDLGLYES